MFLRIVGHAVQDLQSTSTAGISVMPKETLCKEHCVAIAHTESSCTLRRTSEVARESETLCVVFIQIVTCLLTGERGMGLTPQPEHTSGSEDMRLLAKPTANQRADCITS